MAFTGKVAFITGGGSGMGRLAAQNLADAGAVVAALDVDTQGLEETAKDRPRWAIVSEQIAKWRGIQPDLGRDGVKIAAASHALQRAGLPPVEPTE